jgi:hypothetical protein
VVLVGFVWVDLLWGFVGFVRVVFVGCLWVLLVSLGLLWVHLGALSYTLCIIGWRPL